MCEHERLRTVGDRVFCCACGRELTLDFLMNHGKPAEPAAGDKKPAENQADGKKPGKSPGRKPKAKNAE